MYRSTQREILIKKPKKYLCILGDCLEKFICSSFPVKTDGRVPSQQSAPTTCSLTYCEVSLQTYVQILLPSLGVGSQCKIQPFIEGGWGAVGGAVADKYHIPATLDNKSPQTPWIGHLPAIIFLPRQYHFIKSPRQQKFT